MLYKRAFRFLRANISKDKYFKNLVKITILDFMERTFETWYIKSIVFT